MLCFPLLVRAYLLPRHRVGDRLAPAVIDRLCVEPGSDMSFDAAENSDWLAIGVVRAIQQDFSAWASTATLADRRNMGNRVLKQDGLFVENAHASVGQLEVHETVHLAEFWR